MYPKPKVYRSRSGLRVRYNIYLESRCIPIRVVHINILMVTRSVRMLGKSILRTPTHPREPLGGLEEDNCTAEHIHLI